MPETLPVHLITGLLGSGKTTCLKHLIQQKPADEHWAILINEFGEVDIDASQLQALALDPSNPSIHIQAVSGGCICCTAQMGLVNTLNHLLSQTKQKLDRIWIEPTGLGHPAKILDAISKTPFVRALELQKIVCVITPQQLTQDRWKKSAVMRDLVTLADTVLLNKIDLSTAEQLRDSQQILDDLYPSKTDILTSQYSAVDLSKLLGTRPAKRLTLLSAIHKPNQGYNENKPSEHALQTVNQQTVYPSKIEGTQICYVSQAQRLLNTNTTQLNPAENAQLLSMGWIWDSEVQFNRVKLNAFFKDIAPYLSRAKGLLKTGNEWQLINWSDGQLHYQDIAWRQDSRLECLFTIADDSSTEKKLTPQALEKSLINTIHF